MAPKNPEGMQKIETAADQGITAKDIKDSKDILNNDAQRKEFVDYCKDPKNNINLKDCLGPSLQGILDDPNTDAETRKATEKLMADLGLINPDANKTATTPVNNATEQKPDAPETEKKPIVINDKNAQDMQKNIESDPALSANAEGGQVFKDLQEAMKSQDPVQIGVALKKAWEYVRTVFFGTDVLNGKNTLGFADFAKVQEEVQNILSKKPSKADIQKTITDMTALIENATNTKKKLGYVYGKSRMEDYVNLQDKPGQTTYEMLAGKLHVGDVLLLNKENPGIGGNLINNLSQNDVDATHTVVITHESPLQFSHAGEKMSGGTGVEYNVNLQDYLKKFPSDVIVMNTTDAMKTNVKKYIDDKTGENDQKVGQYNYLSSVNSLFNNNSAVEANKYNCVQYVSRVLGITDKNYTLPNEFLSLTDKMNPSYMTTLANGNSFTSHDLMDKFTSKPVATTANNPTTETKTTEQEPKKQ